MKSIIISLIMNYKHKIIHSDHLHHIGTIYHQQGYNFIILLVKFWPEGCNIFEAFVALLIIFSLCI